MRRHGANGVGMTAWIRNNLVPQRALALSLALVVVRVAVGGGLASAGQGKIAKLQGLCATVPLPDCEKEGATACDKDQICLAKLPAKCEQERKQACIDEGKKTEAWFGTLTLAGRDHWKLPGDGRLHLALAAGQELVFGLMVLVGLLARFAAIPLLTIMAVAMASAHWSTFNKSFDFTAEVAFCYFALLAVIAAVGPGVLAVDALWAAKSGAGAATKPKPKAKP